MSTLTPLTRLQVDKVILAACKREGQELRIAKELLADETKAHFAWRASNAAGWWRRFAEALDLGEDNLNADQRTALAFLVDDLKIKRRKSEANA